MDLNPKEMGKIDFRHIYTNSVVSHGKSFEKSPEENVPLINVATHDGGHHLIHFHPIPAGARTLSADIIVLRLRSATLAEPCDDNRPLALTLRWLVMHDGTSGSWLLFTCPNQTRTR